MRFSFFIFIIFFPLPLPAQVVINELMYDLEGSDSGREWIEVVNTSNEPVDLSTWRFFENDVNHKLKIIQGDGILPSGEYAIIADNSDNFLIDRPAFQGMLFDSSFSLKNTGEFIALHDADLNEINSVSYIPEWGAEGDGNSLQLSDDVWLPATPTPGEVNATNIFPPEDNSDTQTQDEESDTENNTESTPQNNAVENNGGISFPIEPQIIAYAGENRIVTVSADSVFEGQAYNLKNEPIEGARYVWNFGNGERREGKNILHHYTYPGEYVVILDVSSEKFSVSDRIIVKALPSNIIISKAEPQLIELSNEGSRELNLSWWLLKTKNDYFIFPENTIVLPYKKLIFDSSVTSLVLDNTKNITLLYPNGVVAYAYEKEEKEGEEKIVVATEISPIQQSVVTKNELKNVSIPPASNLPVSKKVIEAVIEEEKSTEKFIAPQQASAIAAAENEERGTLPEPKNSILTWIFALSGILGIAIISVISLKKKPQTQSDEIKIIE